MLTWKNILSDHGLLLMRKDLSHYPNDQDEIKKKKNYKEVIVNIFNMNLNGSSRE